MSRMLGVAFLFLLLALAGGLANARSLYDEEISQMAGKLRSLMVRAERVQAKDEHGRDAIQQELYELSRKLHRLEEEASAASLEIQRRRGSPDRELLFAASIAQSLDLADYLTANYLDTRDRSLLSAAGQAAQLARTLQAQW